MPGETTISEPHSANRLSDLGANTKADQLGQEISPLDLLIVLAEGKIVILAITVIFAILAIVYSLVSPAKYTATVAIIPPQQGTSMAASLMSQLGGVGGVAALASGGLGLKNPNNM